MISRTRTDPDPSTYVRRRAVTQELVRDVLIGLWALAGIVLLIRRPKEPLGILLLAASALALAGSLVDALAPIALGLVPAVGLQMLLGMPDGRLSTTGRRIIAAIFYVAGAGVAAYLWTQRPEYPVWPVVTLCIAVLIAGTIGFVVRYGATSPAGQRRMRWLAWGATVAAIVAVVALGLHALVQWPADVGAVAAAATGLVPISLIAGSSARLERTIDPLLVSTISLAGLTALVVIVYVAIVLGLGRVPRESERTLLVLSMLAAGICALLYFPVHARTVALAKRIVYREQRAPDEAIRMFGTRQSRAIPLDELLLQLTESLRRTLALDLGRGMDGGVRRAARRCGGSRASQARPIALGSAERDTLARGGVTGSAWAKIWLPDAHRRPGDRADPGGADRAFRRAPRGDRRRTAGRDLTPVGGRGPHA